MNPFDMMKNLQGLQAKIAETQERLHSTVLEGNAGGGMVKVRMDGTFKIRSVDIDKSLLNPSDGELIGDLVTAAGNDAHRQVTELMQREMQAAAGGLAIPPELFGGIR